MAEEKVLVFGTMYHEEETGYQVEEWMKQNMKIANNGQINPQWQLIDSKSPIEIDHFLFGAYSTDYFTFPDNIGHLARNGRDGWGRAFCRGVEIAIEQNYDWLVHIESDMLSRVDVANVIEFLKKHGMDFAAPLNHYGLIETGLMWMRVQALKEVGFIEQYDWEHSPVEPLPEDRVHDIFMDTGKLVIMRSCPGMRDDGKDFPMASLKNLLFLTHASREKREAFMQLPTMKLYDLTEE